MTVAALDGARILLDPELGRVVVEVTTADVCVADVRPRVTAAEVTAAAAVTGRVASDDVCF